MSISILWALAIYLSLIDKDLMVIMMEDMLSTMIGRTITALMAFVTLHLGLVFFRTPTDPAANILAGSMVILTLILLVLATNKTAQEAVLKKPDVVS